MVALRERWKRKFPTQEPPKAASRDEIELVARCTAMVTGGREQKLATHHHAIELSAFERASPEQMQADFRALRLR